MNTLMVLGLGVVLGMQHATEADHLAAVATLSGNRASLREGLRQGAAWGLGHTLVLLVVAGGAGLLGWVISPELAGRFEQVVGAMLIGLGLNLAWRLWRARVHFHAHRHAGEAPHFHGHQHPAPALAHAQDPHGHSHRMPARSLLVGMVHGLAGSAALALLVSQTLPTPAWGLAYIAVFGLGSILGMALLSGALAFSLQLTAGRLTRLHNGLNGAMAACSIALGVRLLLMPV